MLGAQVLYVVEGLYLPVGKHALYVALPTDHDIYIHINTQHYLCMVNKALYVMEQLEWYPILDK